MVDVGDSNKPHLLCTGQVAANTFLTALRTCNDTRLAGYLHTRAFDSGNGPYKEGVDDGGGAVGINHSYFVSAGYSDVGGSFAIAGDDSLSMAGFVQARGDLKLAGSATVPGYTKVARDAWFGGTFTDLGPVTIEGDLHHEKAVNAIPLSVGGTRTQEPVSFDRPCNCDPASMLDVPAIVAQGKASNDNASIGLDPARLSNVVGSEELTLSCGRYYLQKIGGVGSIVVNVTARAVLFVDGDLVATGNLQFKLSPGAQIDVFIRDNLLITGNASFGDKDHPAGTRLYVGGTGDVVLTGAGAFVGNVYAPRSKVTAVGFANVYGSVFANDFVVPGYARFVYDRSITDAGEDCDLPGPGPGTCDKCGSCPLPQACVDGACGPCEQDSDCCGLQVCKDGKCLILVK